MKAILQEALRYHGLGWSIIPMAMTKKRPARRWKTNQARRATVAALEKWFGNGAEYGIGVIFGDISGGLASRDFDDMPAYERWAANYPEFAKTLPTVATRRGRHVYCKAAPGSVRAIRAAIGKPEGTGAISCGDGELRAGPGCYSVLPPSKHPSGAVYEWLIPPAVELPVIDLATAGFLCGENQHCNGEAGERRAAQMTLRRLEAGELRANILEVNNRRHNHQSPSCPQSSQFAPSSLDSLPSLLQEQVEAAISRTVPKAGGLRHRQIFEFARELKAIPALADAPARELKPFFQRWHDLALPHILTKAFEESWFDFGEGWGKVKCPKGQEPIAMLFAKAVDSELPTVAEQYDQSKLRLLVALCRELQRAAGDDPFFLSARTAGGLVGVDHSTASRWLRGLQLDGILQLVVKGTQEAHKASRYRYLADF